MLSSLTGFGGSSMTRGALLLSATLLLSACGGGSDLSGPSNTIPNVAGSYSGTTTVSLPDLGESETCPTTTAVTQSGSNISMAALVLGGACGNMSIPVGERTIDATGSLGLGTTSTTQRCGTYNLTASGGFFGRD